MVNNRTDVQNVLSQMRQMRAQMQVENAPRPERPNPVSPQNGDSGAGRSIEGIDRQPGVNPSAVQGLNSAQDIQDAPRFGEMFKSAIDTVNASQDHANSMRTAFEEGRPGVSLPDVMVAANKASVSFDATVEVRNKLIEAYKEIMNMPV